MPILTPTDLYGEVAFLGLHAAGAATIETQPADAVAAAFEGFEGDSHSGLTRPSCVRVKLQHPRGTEIRNERQITIVSVEELADVAAAMTLPEPLRPEWLGANLALSGLPQLTFLPPSARLIFDSGASLVVDMENAPCKGPAEVIEAAHPGKGLSFPRQAVNKRGVTAWVERPGAIRLGDRCRLHVPPLRLYEPALRRRAQR